MHSPVAHSHIISQLEFMYQQTYVASISDNSPLRALEIKRGDTILKWAEETITDKETFMRVYQQVCRCGAWNLDLAGSFDSAIASRSGRLFRSTVSPPPSGVVSVVIFQSGLPSHFCSTCPAVKSGAYLANAKMFALTYADIHQDACCSLSPSVSCDGERNTGTKRPESPTPDEVSFYKGNGLQCPL